MCVGGFIVYSVAKLEEFYNHFIKQILKANI